MDQELLNQLLQNSGPLLLVSLLISVGSALLCGYIAARRQARWVYWSVMGFAFGPFALPFVFFAKPKQTSGTKPE
jgi:ABC-type dipeptide/oligopeptide/nickel transport system permease component